MRGILPATVDKLTFTLGLSQLTDRDKGTASRSIGTAQDQARQAN
jgi:hypothetical protein